MSISFLFSLWLAVLFGFLFVRGVHAIIGRQMPLSMLDFMLGVTVAFFAVWRAGDE